MQFDPSAAFLNDGNFDTVRQQEEDNNDDSLGIINTDDGSDIYYLAVHRDWDRLRNRLLSQKEAGSTSQPLYCGPGGKTVLHEAVEKGAPSDIIQIIIDSISPSDVAITDKFGQTALHIAGWIASPPSVCQILLHANPDAALIPDRNGGTPLHLAMDAEGEEDTDANEDDADEQDRIEFVRAMLEMKPDTALTTDKRGRTPLHRASASYYAPVKVISLLTDVQPSAALMYDHNGNVPLHLASRGDDIDATAKVSILLKIAPKAALLKDGGGRTPLDCAIFWYASLGVVRELVEVAPEANTLRNGDGFYPLGLLCHIHSDAISYALSNAMKQSVAAHKQKIEEDYCCYDHYHLLGRYHLYDAWRVACTIVKAVVYGVLADFYPDGTELLPKTSNDQTYYFLHASLRFSECPLKLLWLGSYICGRTLKLPDKDGNLPLHIAAETIPSRLDRGKIGDNGDLILSHSTKGTNLIEDFITRYPSAVQYPNKDGRLPLGIFIDAGGMWQDGAAALFEAYPAAIVKECIDIKVFPHLISKTWKKMTERSKRRRGLDVVFELLVGMPDLIPS